MLLCQRKFGQFCFGALEVSPAWSSKEQPGCLSLGFVITDSLFKTSEGATAMKASSSKEKHGVGKWLIFSWLAGTAFGAVRTFAYCLGFAAVPDVFDLVTRRSLNS